MADLHGCCDKDEAVSQTAENLSHPPQCCPPPCLSVCLSPARVTAKLATPQLLPSSSHLGRHSNLRNNNAIFNSNRFVRSFVLAGRGRLTRIHNTTTLNRPARWSSCPAASHWRLQLTCTSKSPRRSTYLCASPNITNLRLVEEG